MQCHVWVRARMDAVGEDNEESKRAKEIKQSWVDVADTITATVNTAWMRKHPPGCASAP
jgi:hypothetical protein